MGKIKLKTPGHGPIAQRVIRDLKKHTNRKILDLQAYRQTRQDASDSEKRNISEAEMADLDPLHAAYAYAQNKLAALIEQLSALPALSPLIKPYFDAEDVYLPSGPPMSPLTQSYFSCWGFFDLCAGLKKETLATVVIDVGKALKIDSELITIFDTMQRSRMGIYRNDGADGSLVRLTEFITGQSVTAIVPAGYQGETGEIWFTRVMPPPVSDIGAGYSLVFLTPYILVGVWSGNAATSPVGQWEAFLERTLPKTGVKETVGAYEKLMKYGLSKNYWNEFIMDGFLSSKPEAIALAGVPDVRSSLPHAND